MESIRQDAADYFASIGRSPRGLKDWDLSSFMKAIRAVCTDPAIVAWDESDDTLPQRPSGAPVKRLTSNDRAAS